MRSSGSKKHPDIVGDNGLGRSRGGFGTKIHLATDGGGLPLNIVLSPGQAHESQFAQRLLDGIGVQRQNGSMKRRGHAVLADKAYSGHALRNELKSRGIKPSFLANQMRKWRQMVVHSSIVMLTVIAMLLNVALVA
ncbi:Transposase and inactivated derivatives [Edwardsiella tarda]|nr:Transposase and inactivated derivatives [Edwardsiella tarda]